MAAQQKYFDITNAPDLLRLAEEVRATREPCVLRRADEDIAVVVPVKKRRARRSPSQADYEAFISSAGGWKGLVDAEELKRNIAEARGSSRPPVRLDL